MTGNFLLTIFLTPTAAAWTGAIAAFFAVVVALNQNKRTRQDSAKPIVYPIYASANEDALYIRFKNIGVGPAMNMYPSLIPYGNKRSIHSHKFTLKSSKFDSDSQIFATDKMTISPTQEYVCDFRLPPEYPCKLNGTVSYKSVFGNTLTVTFQLELSEHPHKDTAIEIGSPKLGSGY